MEAGIEPNAFCSNRHVLTTVIQAFVPEYKRDFD